MELLASGHLRKLGMERVIVFPDAWNAYDSLQFLFDLDFRSYRISDQTDRMLLLLNRELHSYDLFASDFACGTHVAVGMQNTNCEAWSNTGVIGHRVVPEPSTFALLGIGLAALGFVRSPQASIDLLTLLQE